MIRQIVIYSIIWILIALIFFYYLPQALGSFDLLVKHDFEICSLTFFEPFYNCDEKWRIIIFANETMSCGVSGHSVGCADTEDKYAFIQEKYIGNYNPIFNMTTLEHELLHLKCSNYNHTDLCVGHFKP